MQIFYINQNSELPKLRVELVNDGRFDFIKSSKLNNAIQNADVTFSMWDENDKLRISDAVCNIIFDNEAGCESRCILEYSWKKRDTREKGKFKGQFKIDFRGGIVEYGVDYPTGELIVPIYEDLLIFVK